MPGMPGMPGMEGMPGMPGMEGMGNQQQETPPTITKLRVVLLTDKGQIASDIAPIDTTQEVADGWYRVTIPFTKVGGPALVDAKQLQQVAIFGDVKEYMWVGRAQLVSETQPLVADAGQNRTVKVKQEVTFTAADQPNGGAARYKWDFDDWDGIQEDALGRSATWKFMEPGFYTVTLTVIDPGNQKLTQVAHVDVLVTK